jgi:hypothetical protein
MFLVAIQLESLLCSNNHNTTFVAGLIREARASELSKAWLGTVATLLTVVDGLRG